MNDIATDRLYESYLMRNYNIPPDEPVRGEGVRLTMADGTTCLDCVGGIATCSVGHSHPELVRAVCEQASKLMHTSNLFAIRPQAELAAAVCAHAFEGRMFFCNSGAEAVEAALKLARRYGRKNKGGADGIISTDNSFHGRTFGALSVTGQKKYRVGFEPVVPKVKFVPYGDIKAMQHAIDQDSCAVILEPVQGESGVHVPDTGYLNAVSRICRETGTLLILDEVQTGMGRTGKWFAYQHTGITPDIIAMAKGLGGGFPIGAILASGRADCFEPGDHASTFGGNFLAARAALAVIGIIEKEGLVEKAASMGEYFKKALAKADSACPGRIEQIRGLGLMIGVQLFTPAMPVIKKCRDNGLLVCPAGPNVVRFVPPLVITEKEIDEAVSIFTDALKQISDQ